MTDQNISRTKRTSQAIDNFSFDEETLTKVFLPLEYDPSGATLRKVTDNLATKVTESGLVTYVAEATPGSSQSSAVWRVQKIDETTGAVITWADGNTNFDNVATDLTALTYS